MKDQIINIYKNVFEENPTKDKEYYQSLGIVFPDNELPPQYDKFTLTEGSYEYFTIGLNFVFEEASNLIQSGNYKDVFSICKLIIRENAKLYKKAHEWFLIPDQDLIKLISDVSNTVKEEIITIAISTPDENLKKNILVWFFKEISRKEYEYGRQFLFFSDLFIELSSKSEDFTELARRNMKEFETTEIRQVKFLILGYYFVTGNTQKVISFLANNELIFSLKKYFIELLNRFDRKDEALKYALEFFDQVEEANSLLWKSRLQERNNSQIFL
jgi:hypothetical protein